MEPLAFVDFFPVADNNAAPIEAVESRIMENTKRRELRILEGLRQMQIGLSV